MKEIGLFIKLIDRINWILADNTLISKYQNLLNAINANQIYNDIVTEIVDLNEERNLDLPYYYEKKYAVQLGIDIYFGHTANQNLFNLLEKGRNSIKDLQKIVSDLTQIKGAFHSIKQQFSSLSFLKNLEYDENSYLELIYDGKQEIENLSDLHKFTKDLEKHILALSRYTGNVISKPEIKYISKNSPFDIALFLGNTGAVYYLFDFIIKRILDRIIQVQEIRKKELEIKNLKLSNKKIEEGFQEQVDELEKDFADKLAEELYQEYKPDSKMGAKAEIVKGAKNAIIYFDNLVVNGGTVNIGLLPEEKKDEEGNQTIEFSTNDILEKNSQKNILEKEVLKLYSKNGTNLEDKNIEEDDQND